MDMMNFFMNAMRSGGNPNDFMMNMLSQQNTPMSNNLLKLAKEGNTKELEKIARNMCQQRGINFDQEFRAFKRQFGL